MINRKNILAMKKIITILMSGLYYAGISLAGNVLINGNAESGPCGWSGKYDITTQNVFKGKYSFVIEIGENGQTVFAPGSLIPLNNVENLNFSGVMRAEDAASGAVSVELELYDDYAMPYEYTSVLPIPGSESTLMKSAQAGDKTIYISPETNWQAGDDVAVVFNVAEEDLNSNTPNMNCYVGGIAKVRNSEFATEVVLKRELERSYPVGNVRLHKISKLPAIVEKTGISNEFKAFSGVAECSALTGFCKPVLTFYGKPGTHIIVDELTFSAVPVEVTINGDTVGYNSETLIKKYETLGHELDLAYYEFGTALDIAAFKLQAAGKDPKNIVANGKNLRAEYLSLYEMLEKTITDIRADQGDANEQFDNRIQVFEAGFAELKSMGKVMTAEAGALTADLPELPEPDRTYSSDYLFDKFILGMDISWKLYGENILTYPGHAYNNEYVALAMNDAGVNLLSLEVMRKGGYLDFMNALRRYTRAPFMPWTSDEVFDNGDSGSFGYFGKVDALINDTDRFFKLFKDYPNCIGVQLDEPMISDTSSIYGSLDRNRLFIRNWNNAYREKSNELLRWGIKPPEISARRIPEEKDTFPESIGYIEWKIFKKDFLGKHLDALYNGLTKKNIQVSTVMMDWNASNPEDTSYVSVASKIPYIGTDLYENGSLKESFSMQLFRNAAKDRAILWPGAGYSCKSSSVFNRSLAVGLAYADGIHMWTYEYCSKYRDPNIFWRYCGSAPNLDDRNRLMLNNWAPYLWDDLCACYAIAGRVQNSLINRESLADAAMLFSERQIMVADNPGKYFNSQVGLYSAFVNQNIPCDILFIDNLTAEKIDSYKMVVVDSIAAMTEDEAVLLQDYVANGGTLVVIGRSSLDNDWGAPLKDFALKRVLGVSYKKDGRSYGTINTKWGDIKLNPNIDIPFVNSSKKDSVDWPGGGIALMENSYGSGRSIYFALPSGGYYSNGYKFVPGIEKILANIYREVCEELPVGFIGLPNNVEVSISANALGETVIVLINRTGLSDFGEISDIPAYKLKLNGGKEVFAPASETVWEAGSDGVVEIPGFTDYQLLIVR